MKLRKVVTSVAALVLGSIFAYLQYDLWTEKPVKHLVLNDLRPRGFESFESAPSTALGPADNDSTVIGSVNGPSIADDGSYEDRLVGFNDQKRSFFSGDYDFSEDFFTPCVPVWSSALSPYKDQPGIQYLEIGAFKGMSICWMLENILTGENSHATAIDPFLPVNGVPGGSRQLYDRNIEASGMKDKVTTIEGFSQVELRNLPLEHFDIIYIDGSRSAAHVLEDAILSLRNLKEGGIMIFDDYNWSLESLAPLERPRIAINAFVSINRDRVEVLHAGYQIIVRKKKSE